MTNKTNKRFKNYELKINVKNDLKKLAKLIKQDKSMRKKDKRQGRTIYDIDECVRRNASKFRSAHIAYCLLRGTSYEKIEKPREGNSASWHVIDAHLEKWGAEIEKDVCIAS